MKRQYSLRVGCLHGCSIDVVAVGATDDLNLKNSLKESKVISFFHAVNSVVAVKYQMEKFIFYKFVKILSNKDSSRYQTIFTRSQ